ncbi:stage II sporulation protein D [Tissierella sp.]|uniref:stage II sporulation protein D n=1 Tax=Tissierella sp. TaxID=41274 RepID=UPI00303681CB
MRKIGIYMMSVLIITILLPSVIVKTLDFVPKENVIFGEGLKDTDPIPEVPKIIVSEESVEVTDNINTIKLYNPYSNSVEEIDIESYVKGVVAAEMPAEFHIEALKAQAVAARTYATLRSIRYPSGHPYHPKAPVCREVHCQDYLSLEELRQINGESWVENYWGKIEEAVNATKGLLIYYNGEIIEPLYHSTSGGMTEDAVNVYASDEPYLKSVASPNEEDAPRYKSTISLTCDEFISKIIGKYPDVKITKNNFHEQIKLIEKTDSGRIKKIAIGKQIIDGREFRDLLSLNSTNFVITYDKKLNIIEIVTYGFGHGVGMSQWGANGMAKKGSDFIDILSHYYTGIEIR